MNKYHIYTDGAFSTTRQTMGYAFVVLKNNEKIYSYFNGEKGGTNNRAEIISAIEAIEYMIEQNVRTFTIYSDSMYLVGTMTKGWQRNTNNDLWDRLDIIRMNLEITWLHLKGHEGNKYNELCDALAVEGSHIKFE